MGPLLACLLLGNLPSAGSAHAAEATPTPQRIASLPPGSLVPRVATLTDATQSWALYLPKGYSPQRRWPVLLLFDPRARGEVPIALFRDAADELGWILASSNDTRSDGPAQVNARAINAMIPDVMKRLPIDEGRIYAGGFSGGGVLAWTVGLKGGYLAGVISVGGRPAPEHLALTPKFALHASAGNEDPNHLPTVELDRIAARAGVPHRLAFYPGPHAWFPKPLARDAMVWLELLAARDGKSTLSPESLEALRAEELTGARSLEESGDALSAARRHREVAVVVPAAKEASEKRAAELESSPAGRATRKDEESAERFEAKSAQLLAEAIGLLRAPDAPPLASLRARCGMEESRKRAADPAAGPMAAAARRALSAIHTHFGFYQMRELFEAKDFRRATLALTLAAEAVPSDPTAWYNLACAQARSGAADDALSSLGKALDRGMPAPAQMESDADLVSLRERPEFAKLLERARSVSR